MHEISCIFCNTESNHIVIEENGYKGRKCAQCGLIYVSPRPSFDQIVDLYGHNEAHVSAETHLAAELAKRLYARHHLRIIRSFIKGGMLLEVGAGAGYFLDEARNLGFTPHGLEFNPIQADYIRNKLGIACEESPLSTTIFGGERFDVIYHCDVISHLFDPISDFRTMNEIIKKDGFLIFETGNLGEVDLRYFRHFDRFQYPDHLFFFSTDNLIKLLDETGFTLEKMYRYSIVPELMTRKALSGVKYLIRKQSSQSSGGEEDEYPKDAVDKQPRGDLKAVSSKSSVKKSIKRAHKYLNYALRYKIGQSLPKRDRPQTVIVVARKKAFLH